ncbi:hypothetical protein ACFW4K_17900 [Nocardiopsis alba]
MTMMGTSHAATGVVAGAALGAGSKHGHGGPPAYVGGRVEVGVQRR